MTLSQQILWGSFYLGLCFLIEIGLLTWCTIMVRKVIDRWEGQGTFLPTAGPIALALAVIVATHTI